MIGALIDSAVEDDMGYPVIRENLNECPLQICASGGVFRAHVIGCERNPVGRAQQNCPVSR